MARYGYHGPRDLALAQAQHRAFADVLREEGVIVHLHEAPLPGMADSVYACDPALITPRGAVQLRMGKPIRRPEAAALASAISHLGVEVVGAITAPGTVEGGDCLWLDDDTLAVGIGYRTNAEGIRQLGELVRPARMLVFQLPHYRGADECMHLQSLFSFVDIDRVLIHLPLCPAVLVAELEARRIDMVSAAAEEFDSLATNVLCLEPGRVLTCAGSPRTADRLSERGIEVISVEAPDLMWNGSGGPTCLTLPLERQQ